MSPGHRLLHGSILVFLAEALFPLTAIVTTAFLTRCLGAADYGILTLAATFISWIELAIGSLFSRATVKVISDTDDWQAEGASIMKLHLWIGAGAMVICWLLAKPMAALLHEPGMAGYVALFALDIPIYSLASCHRSVLIGKGNYAERALMSAGRWIARLILIVVLVELGLSLRGAILGSIGASLVELAIARYHIRFSWSKGKAAPPSLWNYAVPIFMSTLILRSLNLGLLLLKMLGASAVQAGIYGAAQNVSFVMPGICAVSLSPLLLSTITRVAREGNLPGVKTLCGNSIRIVTAMLPFAAVAAAASNEIAVLLFGARFAGAGPLIAVLIFAGLAMLSINLQNAVLIAFGKPSWTLYLAAPLIPVAVVGYCLVIPRFGLMGAASVTTAVTCMGAFSCMITVRNRLGIVLPVATCIRSLPISGIAYLFVCLWPTPGILVVVKIAVAVILVIGGFMALGELQKGEIDFFRSIIRRTLFGRTAENV